MLNLYPRSSTASSGDGGDNDVDGFRVFYGIAVVCLSIFLFCVLAASVSVWKACAYAAMAALVLSIAGFFTPKRWVRRSRSERHGSAEAELAAGASAAGVRQRPTANGLSRAPANAPPAFDVRGGDTVRQLPTCRHLFHVGCIDMWLHSHRTCPMCRCVVSPPTKVTEKAAAEEVSPESSADDNLPPV
ncbi:hypothetical protein E2562_025552 [Oryza meyeriana var. granulata]|uniref:RING-type domain-containing protein n=1 Tax=Oryza meyeriana var. granulata TaxID=110450 RepID=A0A6G1FCC3_9ORYZ|nr:hypothetical protein E2562_025552 [Oryza meyeriana var. granulata]